jgi:hypothetical protein
MQGNDCFACGLQYFMDDSDICAQSAERQLKLHRFAALLTSEITYHFITEGKFEGEDTFG